MLGVLVLANVLAAFALGLIPSLHAFTIYLCIYTDQRVRWDQNWNSQSFTQQFDPSQFIFLFDYFPPGDTACSDGETITPLSVTMSSTKKKKFGPDNCVDGDLDTTCRTKNEPYPTLTIDFGKVVEIGQVSLPRVRASFFPLTYLLSFGDISIVRSITSYPSVPLIAEGATSI